MKEKDDAEMIVKTSTTKQNIVSSNNYSTGYLGSGFNPSTTIIPTEQFKSILKSGYKSIKGFDKEVPSNLTLKELVGLMVAKYRNDDSISDEQMGMNIYSTCVAALASKEQAFRLIINNDGIDCQVCINGESVYL